MIRSILLLLLMLSAIAGYAQTDLRLSTSAKPQPARLFFDGPRPEKVSETYDLWPVFRAEFGLRKNIANSGWFILPEISYRFVHFGSEMDVRDINNNPLAEDVYSGNYYNFLGARLGAGYELSLSRYISILLPLGFQVHLPFASELKIKDSRFEGRPLFRNEDFENGISYGPYFNPGVDFRLKPDSQWSFSVFGEANMLFRNWSELNPILLWGGGLGVNYRLNHRSRGVL